ncbi:MAG: polyphosphate kinase [Gammaproteobacteria bacterium]|nr:polyphosphate kinase [Gammaproteobacteria bacterium]
MKSIRRIQTPYSEINLHDYWNEKKRLQFELLQIQQDIVREGQKLVITFDGRDAAGKGATIKRFVENLMPKNYRVIELGIPTKQESKRWFLRYEKLMPEKGEIVFFDRSWYNRALIEPTMGYCSKAQYQYFMRKVLDWEHSLLDKDIQLVKFYLSVDSKTQLVRFNQRVNDPFKYWKLSPTDLQARKKWDTFTKYKEQMLAHTSSERSPWITVNSNSKIEARLTCMLHIVRLFSKNKFIPLTGQDVYKNYSIEIDGIPFNGLTAQQYAILNELTDINKTIKKKP